MAEHVDDVAVGVASEEAAHSYGLVSEGVHDLGAPSRTAAAYAASTSSTEEVGRAHAEVFAEIRPATSMVEVSKLIDPALLVLIEADAVIP